ncbi:MAG: hypothetical protein K8H86_05600, partial [Ignavibacteriaceae bacterium]|nr:hypothetical protein [Ignavibacteriaceae bacterium]
MNFIDEVNLSPATTEDIDIVLESIIEAEKSSTNVLSSCLIFNISENEFREVLNTILLEEIEDCELALSGYLVAKYRDEKIGALCSWVEGINGYDSAIIKANLLFAVID